MSRTKTIRDNVTAAIAALPAVTSRSITPVAVWIPPERARETIDDAEILVAPASREIELIGRGGAKYEITTIQAAIYNPLDAPTEDATAEGGQLLAEAISDGLLGVVLAGGATVISAAQPTLLDVEHWRAKRLFTSYVELRCRG